MVGTFFYDLRKFINDLRKLIRVFTQAVKSARLWFRLRWAGKGAVHLVLRGFSPVRRPAECDIADRAIQPNYREKPRPRSPHSTGLLPAPSRSTGRVGRTA